MLLFQGFNSIGMTWIGSIPSALGSALFDFTSIRFFLSASSFVSTFEGSYSFLLLFAGFVDNRGGGCSKNQVVKLISWIIKS